MANKKGQEAYINFLKAVKSKDLNKIQTCGNSIGCQQKQLARDIREIVEQRASYKKFVGKLQEQLNQLTTKHSKLEKQYEKLKLARQKLSPSEKVTNQLSKVFQCFKSDTLEQAKKIIENPEMKKMLMNLSQYQQLKVQFCDKLSNKSPRFVDLKVTSDQYRQLTRKLQEKSAPVDEVHNIYANYLWKILQLHQIDLSGVSKLPQSTKESLERISMKIINLTNRDRSYMQVLKDHPEKIIEWEQEMLARSNLYQRKMHEQKPIRNNSRIYDEEEFQQPFLERIRDKIEVIQQLINQHWYDKVKIMKKEYQQVQILTLEKVISILKKRQVSQIQANRSNGPKQDHDQEHLVTTAIAYSQKLWIKQLEKIHQQFRQQFKQRTQAIIESGIESPFYLSSFENETLTDQQLLLVLKTNLEQLIKDYRKLKGQLKQKAEDKQFQNSCRAYSMNYSKSDNNIYTTNRILEGEQFKDTFIQDLQKQIQDLNKVREQCQQSLQEKENIIKNLKQQIQTFKTQNSSLKINLVKQGGKMKNMQNENMELGKSLMKYSMVRPQFNINHSEDEMDQLKSQLQKLKKEIILKENQIKKKNEKLSQLSSKVEQLQAQLKAKKDELSSLSHEDTQLKKKQLQLQKDNAKLKDKVAQLNSEMDEAMSQNQRINKMYQELSMQKQVESCKFCQQRHYAQPSVQKIIFSKTKSENINHLNAQSQQTNFRQQQILLNQLHQQKKQLQQQIQKTQQKQRTIKAISAQKQLLYKKAIQAKSKIQQLLALKTKNQQIKANIVNENFQLKRQLQAKDKQIAQLKGQIDKKKLRIEDLQQKIEEKARFQQRNRFTNNSAIYQVKRYTEHLFNAGDIFDQYYEQQRLELVKQLETHLRPIKRTKLIYKYDTINRVNFHKYIDDHKHIVLVIKTLYGKVIAAYSEECFNSNGTKKGNAYLMALWNKKIYQVFKDKKGITYDDYFLIFGNSEIRIRSLQSKFFSNFGVGNSYFNNLGDKIEQFAGQKDRQIDMLSYQLYELQFE